MKNIKLPSSTVLIVGGLGAFWVSGIVNPGFFPIGIMVFMLIPVLIFELLYPESEIDKLLVPGKPVLKKVEMEEESADAEPASGELLEEASLN